MCSRYFQIWGLSIDHKSMLCLTIAGNIWMHAGCLLHTFCLFHNQGNAFSYIISSVWASEVTFWNVTVWVVLVCSVCIIIGSLYAIYIRGCCFGYSPRNRNTVCSWMVIVSKNLNKVTSSIPVFQNSQTALVQNWVIYMRICRHV
jgi:hypothetical protein